MKRLKSYTAAIFVVSLLWTQQIFAEVAIQHRIVATSQIKTGTHIIFHLTITNLGPQDIYHLSLTPVDQTLSLMSNEELVNLALLQSGQQVIVPWSIDIPYEISKNMELMSIGFQGRASGVHGESQVIYTVSQVEGAQ